MSAIPGLAPSGAEVMGPGGTAARLARAGAGRVDLERRSLELSSVLQSTLELDKLIALFARELATVVPHDGLSFIAAGDDGAVSIGAGGMHCCDYQIDLGSKPLGSVIVRRRYGFADWETRVVETLLCALVYPLRNALLYRLALASALTDPVTGINNRAALDATLAREVELAQRHELPLSLVMLDVDRFKQINDRHGHLAGDEVLRRIADTIAECIRRSDIVFRYGGEEFAVILANTELDGAALLARRVCVAIARQPVRRDEAQVPVTVSVGVSTLEAGDCGADLLDKADRALYQAKVQGRNRVVEYAP